MWLTHIIDKRIASTLILVNKSTTSPHTTLREEEKKMMCWNYLYQQSVILLVKW